MVIYVMKSCPDCTYVESQITQEEATGYEIIDIGEKTSDMKAFLKIRDTDPAFETIRGSGSIGIPCFVLDDGKITLKPEEAGFRSRPVEMETIRKACRLDGSGC